MSSESRRKLKLINLNQFIDIENFQSACEYDMIDFSFPNIPLTPNFMGKWRVTLNVSMENEAGVLCEDCIRFFADLADTMYGG